MTSLPETIAYLNAPFVGADELDRCLAELASGDSKALELLYHSTSSSIYSFALSILKNPHDAEDVLHDCFLNIYAGAAGYRSSGKPMAWILTIAKTFVTRSCGNGRKPPTSPRKTGNPG